jgi:hypothetical protein
MNRNTKENPMNGLPKELVAKMEAAKAATNEPCPTCHVGRGRWCRDENGQNAKEIHAARPR